MTIVLAAAASGGHEAKETLQSLLGKNVEK